MSEKILVTGGAGFIGSHLIDGLIGKNEIVCVDNFDPYYDPGVKRKNIVKHLENKKFVLKETDVRDKKGLEGIFKEGIDKVVHLAAKAGVRFSIENPFMFADVNINGTLNLLDLCKAYGIRNFVYASSSSVYGLNKTPFREDDRVEKIEMYGDGTSKRDYTYITDIVDGVANALGKKFDFEIFNLGESKTVELKYLISLIENNLGKKAGIKRRPDQKGDVPETFADISKSKRLLGYNPKVRIEEGIKRFIDWYLENKS